MTSNTMNEFGGSWTQQKLEILKQYLESYTTALKGQRFELTYVDAFAGTGYIPPSSGGGRQGVPLLVSELDGDASAMLKGSARLALDVDSKPFDHFVFVEQNQEYARELHKLKAEFASRDINVEQADANEFLPRWCTDRNQRFTIPWNRQRAVVFLDPFATEVNWQTVQCIAGTQSVDLWILFPLSALTRILPRTGEPNESWAHVLDRVYGGSEWRTLYQTKKPSHRQMSFFSDESWEGQVVRDDQQAIIDVYQDKLRSVFQAVAPSPKWLFNSRNSPLFALMFAASNPSGAPIALKIAKHLLEHW